MNTAIFLGAGASQALGLPVTKQILPILLERLKRDSPANQTLFSGDAIDQRRLKKCLNVIAPGLKNLTSDPHDSDARRQAFPTITDVLSAVDYLLISANAPSPKLTLSELAQARMLIERALFELLVRNESPDALRLEGVPDSVRDEWMQTAKIKLLPQRPPELQRELENTVNWIMDLGAQPGDRVNLISTNYDIEVEQELYSRLGYDRVFEQVDFGMSVRDPASDTIYRRPLDARFGLYKLHGSLNWLRCGLCDNVYLNPVGAIAYLSFLLGYDAKRYKRKNPWLGQLEKNGANLCHCGYRPLRHMIVAPSFVREVRDPILLEIWRNALEAMRQADVWIIVGYSLTPEDVAIRSMFLRAYQGRDSGHLPRVVVVQKEEREPELTRYQLLFRRHTYVSGGLSRYIKLPR